MGSKLKTTNHEIISKYQKESDTKRQKGKRFWI